MHEMDVHIVCNLLLVRNMQDLSNLISATHISLGGPYYCVLFLGLSMDT